jgi:D-alanyl-lipoteichoic acid acyltransferase DltB (MBOAT superfamily)
VLFNTYEFVFFFVCVLCALNLVSSRYRWVLLLVASYIFYAGWRPSFTIWLLISTLLDYSTGRIIDSAKSLRIRRVALIFSICINLGILFTFKYLDFFITNTVGLAGFFGVQLPDYTVKLILPLGISFYTFQSLSYVIDVYQGRIKAETHLGLYALYVAFFPQLVAGPIGRAPHLLHQFKDQPAPTPGDVNVGLWLVGFGLFKKMCIADLIAPVVNGIFSQPAQYNGSYLLIATILFAVQIYCDFSGYSDIAIGTARIMGYRLMINFRQPYFSTSLTEFWGRWHISLSTWFRDYLYIPLGGNRVSLVRWGLNILVVFVVSGVWHGAAWAFVAWGAIHGAGMVVERLVRETYSLAQRRMNAVIAPSIISGLGFLSTTCVVLIGWVFFRAASLDKAVEVLRHIFQFGPLEYGTFKTLSLPSFELVLTVINIASLIWMDYLLWTDSALIGRFAKSTTLQICLGVALIYYIVFFGVFERIEFIYFQF